MTNIEFAEKIKGYLKGSKAKAKKYEDTVAVNFTFIDDMDDFYVAVREGVLDVAPYHYDDLQANVTGAAENIEKLFSGDVSFDGALTDGLVKVDGDVAKFKALEALVPAKKAEKPLQRRRPLLLQSPLRPQRRRLRPSPLPLLLSPPRPRLPHPPLSPLRPRLRHLLQSLLLKSTPAARSTASNLLLNYPGARVLLPGVCLCFLPRIYHSIAEFCGIRGTDESYPEGFEYR